MTTYLRTPQNEIVRTDNPEYYKDCGLLMKKDGEALYREQCRKELAELLPVGSKVYTKVDSVSRSGMSRNISVYMVQDGEIRNIGFRVAELISFKCDRNHSLKVGGCGMDMCFHVVYCLGRALYPNGFAVAGRGRNGDTSGFDRDGGYALTKCDL